MPSHRFTPICLFRLLVYFHAHADTPLRRTPRLPVRRRYVSPVMANLIRALRELI